METRNVNQPTGNRTRPPSLRDARLLTLLATPMALLGIILFSVAVRRHRAFDDPIAVGAIVLMSTAFVVGIWSMLKWYRAWKTRELDLPAIAFCLWVFRQVWPRRAPNTAVDTEH